VQCAVCLARIESNHFVLCLFLWSSPQAAPDGRGRERPSQPGLLQRHLVNLLMARPASRLASALRIRCPPKFASSTVFHVPSTSVISRARFIQIERSEGRGTIFGAPTPVRKTLAAVSAALGNFGGTCVCTWAGKSFGRVYQGKEGTPAGRRAARPLAEEEMMEIPRSILDRHRCNHRFISLRRRLRRRLARHHYRPPTSPSSTFLPHFVKPPL